MITKQIVSDQIRNRENIEKHFETLEYFSYFKMQKHFE